MADKPIDEKEVFNGARQIAAPEERLAYLQKACGHDPTAMHRVLELLRIYDQERSFLESSPVAHGATIDEPLNERPGTMIGPYKLLEQIGEGGFGVVFMAEQTEPVRRKVALKVLKPGMDTRQVVARFEAERQALAIMDHPNIAKVLDGGQTTSGRPYFVMDLVKGLPITDYCDQAQLTPRERLELFIPVCQAVQHAHQKGIIHRDLKPSNILVVMHDATPVVKVIDFGVAKALGQELTDKTLFTGFAQMVGTPLYMSPEQAGQSGLDIDTRSDIYSLGVLLYELLTGTTPFSKDRFKQAAYDEIRRIIREEEPPRPSTRLSDSTDSLPSISAQRHTEPAKLTKLVRGELDWIVMKALEKDRNRRYETANSFATDVQRYLADEPVQACPPSAGYRLRKFARRNKTRLAITGLIVLTLFVVAGTLGWSLWREQEAAREQGLRDAALDATVQSALDEAATFANDAKISEAGAALERAEKLLKAAGRDKCPPRLLELQNELAFAQQLDDIATHPKTEEFMWGHGPDAAYAKAFADAGIDLTAIPAADAVQRIRSRSIRRELVRALDRWSFITQGGETKTGPDWKQLLEIAAAADLDSDQVRKQVRDALRLGNRKMLESLAATADARQVPVESLLLLAIALYESGGKDDAMTLARRAVLVHPDDWWLNHYLGWWCFIAQPPQYDQAILHWTASMAIRPRNARTLVKIGYSHKALGQYDKALATYSQAIAVYSQAIELDRNSALAWDAWGHRASAYDDLGQYDKALADYSKAIELAPQHARAGVRLWRAFSRARAGQVDAAIQEAEDLAKTADANMLYNAARVVALAAERADEAGGSLSKEQCAKRAVALLRQAVAKGYNDAEHIKKDDDLKGLREREDFRKLLDELTAVPLARHHVELGEWQKAAADYDKLLELRPNFQDVWFENAYLRLKRGDTKGYRELCRRMLEQFGQSKDVHEFAILAHTWVLAPQTPDDAKRAVQLAEQRMSLTRAHPIHGLWSVHVLSLAYYRNGLNDKAVECVAKGPKDQTQKECNLLNALVLAMAHHRLKHKDEAQKWLEQARQAIDQENRKREKDGIFAPPGWHWRDWLGVQMLREEAEELLGTQTEKK